MDLKLNCESGRGIDNVRFAPRNEEKGILVDVTREYEYESILLGDKDVERLYEYLGERLGKDKESVPEVSIKSTEDKSELLNMSFRCVSDPYDVLDTSLDETDIELYMRIKNDEEVAALYLSSEDALTMAENIIKAFESVGIEAEPVVKEYEAISKADLDKVVADLKELKEDFHSSMKDVVKDWSELNEDINQVHVEISQIQNDIFNNNESTKVKLESLGKHTESVSKEVVAAMEHLATRIDENAGDIHSLKVQEDIRKIKSRSVW